MPVPKSLDRCKINVGQSLEIRPVCLKYLRKTKIHGEHSQKISPVYLTANSWGTIPKIVPAFIQILNSLIYYGCLSIYCHSPFALIPVAIQDRSMFCYSYLLRFRIAYCSVLQICCGTGFLPVLLLPCLPSYLLLSVEKMKILSLPILLLPCLPYIRRIPDCGLPSVPDDRLTDDTLVLHHFFSPFIC